MISGAYGSGYRSLLGTLRQAISIPIICLACATGCNTDLDAVLSPAFEAAVNVIGMEFDIPRGAKRAFWLTCKTQEQRLAWLLSDASAHELDVQTSELSGNASFVNYVRLHIITHKRSGAVLEVVEKSVRKILAIPSLEARFYRERDEIVQANKHFRHPRCYGLIETPMESLIYTHYIRSAPPHMHRVGKDVALGISELETLTHTHLKDSLVRASIRYWQMDFFRPWYLLRPRFSFARCFRHLRTLAIQEPQFSGMERNLRGFVAALRTEAKAARRSPRCICHLDYLRKNLFASRKGLYLIDWSEVKVGRIGFDAGAYLSALFRRNEMPLYEKARDEFLKAYTEALDPKFDKDMALRNARYLFLLNSLWNCMRAETIQEYREAGRLPLLKQKLEYLLSLKSQ